MRTRLGYRIGLALAAAAMATMVAACRRGGDGAAACGDACGHAAAEPEDAHAGHDHAGHGHEGEAAAKPLEARVQEPCEHGVPIIECDECRYEAGVVKVDARLRQGGGDGPLVRTQRVARVRVPDVLTVPGEVALDENAAVHVSPRIAGIIASVSADIGAEVAEGDVLFTLASVELGKARADFERSRALAALAERNVARERRLHAQKVGSEEDVIAAQMEYEQYRAELQAAAQTLRVLGANDAELQATNAATPERLAVRAPRGGTIIEKHAVAGELAEPGHDVMLLAGLDTVWVWAHVHARDLARVLAAERRGPVSAEVRVTAFPDRAFAGRVTYVGATVDSATRTVRVRVAVPNPDRLLRPGMFCDVSLGLGAGDGAATLAAPRAAVLADEGRSFVFKHWRDDFFVMQDVRAGRELGEATEIVAGLEEGDAIVAEGAFLLKSDVLREKMGAGCAD